MLLPALALHGFGQGDPPQQPLIAFRAPFDDNTAAIQDAQTVAPVEAVSAANYDAAPGGRALVAGEGCRLVYDLGAGFPASSGSLGLRFRPDFPQTDTAAERRLLALSMSPEHRLELVFKPVGLRWIVVLVGPRSRRELTLWHGIVKAGQWHDLLLTWDRDEGRYALYLDGAWKAGDTFDRPLAGKVALELGGAGNPETSVDEIVLYARALTEPQAAFLAGLPAAVPAEERLAQIAARLTADDRVLQERRDLVAQLQGRIGYFHQLRRSAGGPVSFPEQIVAEGIRPQDLGTIDLRRFAVIYFPEGPNYEVDAEQSRILEAYVRNGGGYVGSCQGAYFAGKLRLLDYECLHFWVWGILRVHLKPHAVTDDRKEQIVMHFGNGPIMVPGAGCRVLGEYEMGLPDRVPAAILAGDCGRGRVVVFGPHPRGGNVSHRSKRVTFTGRDLDTERLLVNAFLYAARLLEPGDEPAPGTSRR